MNIEEPYDEKRDIIFFADECIEWVTITARQCIVFFPEDAHAPLAGVEPVKKAVFKIHI